MTIAVVEGGDDLIFENLIEVLGIAMIGDFIGSVGATFPDRETIHPVVGLRPPTIEYGTIKPTIKNDLLPTRPRCF